MINMFKGNKANSQRRSNVNYYKSGHIVPIQSAAELLKSRQHQTVIEHIRNIVRLPNEDFELIYLPLIEGFAEFVQLLPFASGAYQGSMLNISLSGALRALIELEKQFAPVGGVVNDAAGNPLLNYCVFSACLLYHTERIMTLQRVILCDDKGTFVENWHPTSGSMLDRAGFYRLYPIGEDVYNDVSQDLTVMLARQLMPEQGFDWIASHTSYFIEWIQALKKNFAFGGKVIEVLSLIKELQDELNPELDNLPAFEDIQVEAPDNKVGEAFYKWLHNQIDDGAMTVNGENSMVHHVDSGIFVDFATAGEFAKIYGSSMTIVFVQFGNLMGITKKGGDDFAFAQFFSDAEDTRELRSMGAGFMAQGEGKKGKIKKGLVVKDPYLLFNKGNLPPVNDTMRGERAARHQHVQFQSKQAAQSSSISIMNTKQD